MIGGRQQLTAASRERCGRREGGNGGHGAGVRGKGPTQNEPELKSWRPRARDPQPHLERVRRELKALRVGTGEIDQGPEREIQRKKTTEHPKREALLETSERQALRSWERSWQS